jgi:hypothetical protein
LKEYLINGDETEGFSKLRAFLDALRHHIEDLMTESEKEGNASHFKLTTGFLCAGLRSLDMEVTTKTSAIFQQIIESKALASNSQFNRIITCESLPLQDEKAPKKNYDHVLPVA